MSWGVATQNGVSVSLASIVSLSCGATEFSPYDLFTAGTVGAWYDPSDYSTLFQDSAGTTPVTAVEQPVGLMLDKSQGLVLGSELVTNGGPDFTSTTGWTGYSTSGAAATLSIVSGWLRVTPNGTSGGWGSATVTYPASWIAVTVQWRTSGGASAARVTTFFPGLDTELNGTSGTQTFYLAKTGGSGELRLHCKDVTGYVEYRVISIKSLPGNHASQATSTSRPVLRARYNLLTYSEQFDNAAWTKAPTSVITAITADTTVAPDGTTTADRIASTATGTFRAVRRSPAGLLASTQFTFTVYAKAGTTNWIVMRFWDSGASGINAWFNVSTGVVGTVESGCTATITPASNGFYRCTYTRTVGATIAFNEIDIGVCDADNTQNATTGVNVSIWGADLRTGSSAGTYQRIAAATDYATAGFLPYLAFDGTDDSFGTASINFSATDKMSVCAGVTKLSDVNQAILYELSTDTFSNNGAFLLWAPGSAAGANYYARVRGSLVSNAVTGASYAAPITNVATMLADIAGDSVNVRLNGTSAATSASDLGTGNFGTYPLFIGRRNNATLPFNGRIYQLVVCGKALSAAELASTEAYVNSKTGAY